MSCVNSMCRIVFLSDYVNLYNTGCSIKTDTLRKLFFLLLYLCYYAIFFEETTRLLLTNIILMHSLNMTPLGTVQVVKQRYMFSKTFFKTISAISALAPVINLVRSSKFCGRFSKTQPLMKPRKKKSGGVRARLQGGESRRKIILPSKTPPKTSLWPQ